MPTQETTVTIAQRSFQGESFQRLLMGLPRHREVEGKRGEDHCRQERGGGLPPRPRIGGGGQWNASTERSSPATRRDFIEAV